MKAVFGIKGLITILVLSFLVTGANKLGDVEINDLTVTGVSTGVTGESSAPDWLTATDYGEFQIIVDPNSGITYRSNQVHTSTGVNLTDDVAKYDIIGSASNGFIGGGWSTPEALVVTGAGGNPGLGTIQESHIRWRRMGENAEVFFSYRQSTAGSNGSGEYFIQLPSTLNGTIDASKFVTGSANTSNNIGRFIYIDNANTKADGGSLLYDKSLGEIKVQVEQHDGNIGVWTGAGVPTFTATALEFSGNYSVPISEWNNSGITVPITDLTEVTKEVNNSVLDLVTASAALTNPPTAVTDARAIAYADSTGKYRIRFNVHYTIAPTQTITRFKFTGVTIDSSTTWAVSAANDAGVISQADTQTGGPNVVASGTTSTVWRISGDIPIDAKPAWFDANRENPAAISAFVPEATAAASGIVGIGSQTFGGAKTFDTSVTVDRDTGDGFVLTDGATLRMRIDDSTAGGQLRLYDDAGGEKIVLRPVGVSTFDAGSNTIGVNAIVTSTSGNGPAVGAWNKDTGTTSPAIWASSGSTKSNNIRFIQFYGSATSSQTNIAAGGVSSNNGLPDFFNESDLRLKKDITDYNDDTLAKFDALRLVKYSWKDDDTNTRNLGVIAQEAELIFPEIVQETDDGKGDEVPEGVTPWTVSSNWNYQLIQAVKQLSSKVKSLEQEVGTLKAAK